MAACTNFPMFSARCCWSWASCSSNCELFVRKSALEESEYSTGSSSTAHICATWSLSCAIWRNRRSCSASRSLWSDWRRDIVSSDNVISSTPLATPCSKLPVGSTPVRAQRPQIFSTSAWALFLRISRVLSACTICSSSSAMRACEMHAPSPTESGAAIPSFSLSVSSWHSSSMIVSRRRSFSARSSSVRAARRSSLASKVKPSGRPSAGRSSSTHSSATIASASATLWQRSRYCCVSWLAIFSTNFARWRSTSSARSARSSPSRPTRSQTRSTSASAACTVSWAVSSMLLAAIAAARKFKREHKGAPPNKLPTAHPLNRRSQLRPPEHPAVCLWSCHLFEWLLSAGSQWLHLRGRRSAMPSIPRWPRSSMPPLPASRQTPPSRLPC
eukprot:m.91874 g.91874  ORF g.91874 m.91874 type:complete len:387 (+) comp8619_c0_seq5:921-2081(+)